MKENTINNPLKKWAVVSWFHQDIMDGRYGQCLEMVDGTYEDAYEAAREWLHLSPISVCGIIE